MPDISSSPFMDFIAQFGIWLFSINLGLSFIGAAMAKKRGYSYGGFLCLGIFTSFIVNLIVAACLKPREGSPYLRSRLVYAPAGIFCRQCGSLCSFDMVFCPKCGTKIQEIPQAVSEQNKAVSGAKEDSGDDSDW